MKGLQTPDVERFRAAISRSVGLYFDDSKLGFLAEVLERRLDATRENAAGYANRLESGRGRRDELRELARELTVPETYFFRHFEQFRAFGEVALPNRVAARGPLGRLGILCAGCASGEEAYSLAILVRESVPDSEARVSIRAVDLNPVMLERAARARYSGWALRDTPDDLRRRWFKPEGREFMLDPSIRSAVAFEELNLVDNDSDVWRDGAYDVVFFRNVLMYLTSDAAQAVVGRLTRALLPGGYLFLGHAETLRGLSHDFHLLHTHDTFYYQRKSELGAAPMDVEFRPLSPPPASAIAAVVDSSSSWVETIKNASDRIKRLAEREPEHGTPHTGSAAETRTELHAALELLRSERFGDALDRLDRLPSVFARDPDVLLLRASLLVHSGELARAEGVCSELILLDELNAGAHYLFALCREGRGDAGEAVDHDQIAVYLDEGFAMARLHLGLMARRAGNRETARRELEHAITLLAREEASRLLLFGGGFGRDGLIALCRAELARLGALP
jgi:chemotaxis protein methyltransferase CheR